MGSKWGQVFHRKIFRLRCGRVNAHETLKYSKLGGVDLRLAVIRLRDVDGKAEGMRGKSGDWAGQNVSFTTCFEEIPLS